MLEGFGGDVDSDRLCIASWKLGHRSGEGRECGSAEEGETSSKRSNMTKFPSFRVETRLREEPPLPADVPLDCVLSLLSLGEDAVAYSGRSEKLSGVTTTPYVPGRCVPAFLSRSSSLVSTSNAGRSSGSREVGLVLDLDEAWAFDLVSFRPETVSIP